MDLLDDPTPGSNTPEFSVGEIAGAVKRLIEGELGWVRVRGEVGRVVQARSGHLYFDLKDERNVLSCMTWKGQIPGIGVMPEEGMEVVAEGRMTASGFQSKFALNAQTIAVAGEGALMALLEKRKKALAAEGLFDDARKSPLPYLPEIIGVVTSLQGVVIRDILHRLRDRFPRKVLVWPVAVQGAACAPEVARAIEGFNALTSGGALPRPDLLIVARGGGSIEDLWGFNEEVVARAAAASDIPLISAVGHETDTTLIDFVSDRRAPTPTAAAEIAVPVRLDLLAWVSEQEARLRRAQEQGGTRRADHLRNLARALPRPEALLAAPRQRLDLWDARLPAALTFAVQARRVRLAQRGALNPSLLRRAVSEDRRKIEGLGTRLAPALERAARAKRDKLDARGLNATVLNRRLEQAQERFGNLSRRLASVARQGVSDQRARLDALDRLRETLSYKATLDRGYAVIHADGKVATRKTDADGAKAIEIEFADGKLSIGSAPSKRAAKPKPPEQGSLF
ncbi:exodeoxyribonuclease VII large subunit [Shimia ponticola]|uniref:exodeoxyribonuclease VII large subunit n=1 Tax=Shimia ponticola TaxID=2582893 RepID=UPI0011BDAEFE|nr:exodeoxyribonuclease VII large subunit [Shimia ponticola]